MVKIVEVEYVGNFDIPETRRKAKRLSEAVGEYGYDGGKLLVIFDGEYDAAHGAEYLSSKPAENVELYVDYLDGGRLELVSTNHN